MTAHALSMQPAVRHDAAASADEALRQPARQAALVRRINQLYHDLTQDVFDAEHHYRHRVECGFWKTAMLLLTENQPTSSGRTVVDLACGTGFLTPLLGASLGPTDRLIALDISSSALRTTITKNRSLRLSPAVGDGAALPLPDASVDLLAINAALHHMPAPSAVCREIDRVLKPGGAFALGYEPNIRHFGSAAGQISRACDRLAWYLSPRQNLRRLCERTGLRCDVAASITDEDRVCRTVNERLIAEGLIRTPLSMQAVLNHVDPHARGADDHAGFEAADLIGQAFHDYEVVRLISTDYLGQSIRRFPTVRTLADAILRPAWPDRGSLMCCILRKPARAGGHNG